MEKNQDEKIIVKKELKNKLMITAASICLLTGIYGASVTMASPNKGNHEGLVEMLATKFNVSEDEVEDTLKKHREQQQSEHQELMKDRLENRLNEAVADGVISEAQKNLILAKKEEMQNKINADLDEWSENKEERREQMEAYREDLKQWAEDNGIELSLIGCKEGGRMMRSFK